MTADLTAEVFAAAFAAADRYRPDATTAAPWLFTIAQNTLVSSVRRGRVEEAARREIGIRAAVELNAGSVARLEHAVVGDAWVSDLLRRLPADQREAIRARVLEDRSYDEIAAELETSSLVLRKRVSRGLAQLRQEMKEGVRNQKFLATAPPRRITSILPSLAALPRGALRVTVRELRALHIDANGIYARYAWQGHTDGVHTYVVPAAVVGTTRTLPARCYREELAAFRREARHFPASQRAAAIAYAQQRFNPEAEAGVSVVTAGWGTRGESNDQTWMLAQLKTEPAFGSGGGGTNSSTTTSLLVTDEVASITATYHAQSYPGRVPRTFSVTKRPVRNLVIFHLSGAWDPPQLTFRSRTGAVIARTHSG